MAQDMQHRMKEVGGKEKFQEAAYGLMDHLSEMGAATKEFAADSAQEIRENIGHLYERGQEKFEGLEQKLEAEIKKYPLRTVAFAAGIGFLLGWLRGKRRS